MQDDRFTAWVREGLDKSGKTQIGLAKHLGIAHPQITQLLKGKRRIKADELDKIAAYLGSKPPLGEAVPIVGYVRAGQEAVLYGEGQGPFDYAPMPPGGNVHTVAVKAQGESMRGRIESGDLVYYDDRHEPPTADLLGRLCVTGLSDGRVMVKRLLAGSLPGLYHLLSTSEDPMLDVPLDWAARVLWIQPDHR
jgi:phage repressor protein C with HTH and peptisase S24 domain